MLCTSCAGTESYQTLNLRLEMVKNGAAARNSKAGACPKCGAAFLQPCPRCDGTGRAPEVLSACSHCGGSILAWRPCPTCHGTGRAPDAQALAEHSCAQKRQVKPVKEKA